MSMVRPGTKISFLGNENQTVEFYVAEHDAIRKAFLVQRPGSAPKWEDEKSLSRFLRSYPQYLLFPANELDPDDPLRIEYTCYETNGRRARTAAVRADKAIKISMDQLEQASDAEEDEQDDAPPTQRARHVRTATVSIGITVNTGGVGANLQPLQPFLQCPISHEIMVDPVVAADGHTYEREALARWLSEKNSSPLTGQPMGTRMVPNHAVKSMIANLSSTSA